MKISTVHRNKPCMELSQLSYNSQVYECCLTTLYHYSDLPCMVYDDYCAELSSHGSPPKYHHLWHKAVNIIYISKIYNTKACLHTIYCNKYRWLAFTIGGRPTQCICSCHSNTFCNMWSATRHYIAPLLICVIFSDFSYSLH